MRAGGRVTTGWSSPAGDPGKGLQVEVVAPQGALVDPDAFGFVVDAVQDQCVGQGVCGGAVPADERVQDAQGGGLVGVAARAVGQMPGEFEQPAGRDRRGRAVAFLVAAVGELQIPVGDQVRGQVGEEVVGAALCRLQERRVPGMAVVQREAVDGPGLSASPAGLVGVALFGLPAQRFPRQRVPVERVEGGAVRAQDVFAQLGGVPVSGVPVAGVAAVAARPEQQRSVHQAVDDGAAALARVGQVAPGLDDAGRFEHAVEQPVGGELRGASRALVSGAPPGGHAAERVQETEVMGIQVDAALDAFGQAAHVLGRGSPVCRVRGQIEREPEHARPETRGPAHVGALGQTVRRGPRQIPAVRRGVAGVALAERGDVRVDRAQRGGHRGPGGLGVGAGTQVDRRHGCPFLVRSRSAAWRTGPARRVAARAVSGVAGQPGLCPRASRRVNRLLAQTT